LKKVPPRTPPQKLLILYSIKLFERGSGKSFFSKKFSPIMHYFLEVIMQKDEMSRTITFSIKEEEKDRERRMLLRAVYDALSEKGYNPIHQLVGYVLTEDPTYITNYKNARGLIRRIDRDELMAALLKDYLNL